MTVNVKARRENRSIRRAQKRGRLQILVATGRRRVMVRPTAKKRAGLRLRAPGHQDDAMARIMIVDDSEDSRDSLAVIFRRLGHEVICVPNGREALSSVLDRLPDVIVLDLLMPDMDGPSFLEVIRSYLRIQSLPVVVVT